MLTKQPNVLPTKARKSQARSRFPRQSQARKIRAGGREAKRAVLFMWGSRLSNLPSVSTRLNGSPSVSTVLGRLHDKCVGVSAGGIVFDIKFMLMGGLECHSLDPIATSRP